MTHTAPHSAPFDGDVYTLIQPAQQTVAVPLIVSVPHSGRVYPASLTHASRLSDLAVRSSEDAFIDQLIGDPALIGATCIIARPARAYVDLNRAPTELDPGMFDGPTGLDVQSTAITRAGLGVIPRIVGQGREIYKKRLPASEALTRLQAAYYPYHAQLRHEIDRLVNQFGRVYVLDCHSMPSHPSRKPEQKQHASNSLTLADMVIGDRWGASCSAEFSAALHRSSEEAGLITGRNHPYAGGYITRHYGAPENPDNQVHVAQLELCRDLYMCEQRIIPADGFNRTKNAMTKIIKDAATFASQQTGILKDGDAFACAPLAAQ